jgi:hypothetical protein
MLDIQHATLDEVTPRKRTPVAALDWSIEQRSGRFRLLLAGCGKSWDVLEKMNAPCTGLLLRDGQELEVYNLTLEQVAQFFGAFTGKHISRDNGKQADVAHDSSRTKRRLTPAQVAARRENARKATKARKKNAIVK